MKIRIRNYRSLSLSQIEVVKGAILLIAGPTKTGKSSICNAIGAVLSGQPAVWADLKKKDFNDLVKDGDKTATLAAQTEQWQRSIAYPSGQVKTKGDPITYSKMSLGLEHLPALPIKDRAALIGTFIVTQPSKEDFLAYEPLGGIDEATKETVWGIIEEKSWDRAHDAAKSRGPELKGQWRQVTGEQWGSAKGEGWAPDVEEEILGLARETLQAAEEARREEENELIGQSAVNSKAIEDMRARAAKLDGLERALTARQEDLKAANDTYEEARAEMISAPDGGVGELREPCPHCGLTVNVKYTYELNGVGEMINRHCELHQPTEENDPDLAKELQRKHVALEKDYGETRQAAKLMGQEVEEITAQLATAKSAADSLEAALNTEDTTEALATARTAHRRATENLAKHKAYHDAQRLHKKILINRALTDALKPDGLRAEVLSRALERFSTDFLDMICEYSSSVADKRWRRVRIKEDLSVTWDGRDYRLLSGSEQWLTRAILQMGFSLLAGEAFVVLDTADLLEPKDRNALFRVLKKTDMTAVVAMTEVKHDRVPDLQAANLGSVYWLGEPTKERA